jgi:hypothetical protein
MLHGILVDMNIQGQMENVRRILEGAEWNEFWVHLNLKFVLFRDIGLDQETSDLEVWRLCQQQGLVLVTANRNQKRVDSLEATLRTENTPTSLPVITVSDQEALQVNKDYVMQVAIKLLEYLFDIEKIRGTGRLYVP